MVKNILKIVIAIIAILIILLTAYLIKNEKNEKEEMPNNTNATNESLEHEIEDKEKQSTKKAVVVKVYDKTLLVLGIEREKSLYDVSFSEEGNIGFKPGQEVLIYFDGVVMTSYPGQISNVSKIEITKEQSDIEIPDDVLEY